jgi:hypothetical protein
VSDEQIEYGRQFPDGEVIPSSAGYVDDPRWLTCSGQPVTWVQRTVTYSDWTPKDPARERHWSCMAWIGKDSCVCTPDAPHGDQCCWVWSDTALPAAPPPAVQRAPGGADLASLAAHLRADASIVENDLRAPVIASRMRVAANRLTGLIEAPGAPGGES